MRADNNDNNNNNNNTNNNTTNNTNNNDNTNNNNNNNNNNDTNNNDQFNLSKWAYKQTKNILIKYKLKILLSDSDVKERMKEWLKTGDAIEKLNRMSNVNDQQQLHQFLFNEGILLNDESESSDNENESSSSSDQGSTAHSQQHAYFNFGANTIHTYNANDPTIHRQNQGDIFSPEMPIPSHNITQHQPPNTDISQSTNLIRDKFQWNQLSTEQSCVLIYIYIYIYIYLNI